LIANPDFLLLVKELKYTNNIEVSNVLTSVRFNKI